MSKSSHKSPSQILGVISITRAERMLREWVNTDLGDFSEDAKAWERLFRRYPEIPSVPVTSIVPSDDIAKFDRFHQQMEMASAVAADLARAWEETDFRHFEWYTWHAQTEYEFEAANAKHGVTPSHTAPQNPSEDLSKFTRALTEASDPPDEITPVEAAIFHLRRNRKRALCCPNPDCPAPYFFASKKGQKYCSAECAKPSQGESKRRWWAEHRGKSKNLPKKRS